MMQRASACVCAREKNYTMNNRTRTYHHEFLMSGFHADCHLLDIIVDAVENGTLVNDQGLHVAKDFSKA